MFGKTQRELLCALEAIRKTLCCYIGSICDCKFGNSNPTNALDKLFPHGEQTGCPEIRQAIEMLGSLTNDEFNELREKAEIKDAGMFQKALQDKKNLDLSNESNDIDTALNEIKQKQYTADMFDSEETIERKLNELIAEHKIQISNIINIQRRTDYCNTRIYTIWYKK